MAINHITNSQGTILNRYKLNEEGQQEKTITLDFYPSSDYIQGSPYNEAIINPIIDGVNIAKKVIYRQSVVELSGTPTQLSEYCAWDKNEEYGYYLDLSISGLLEVSDKVCMGAYDTDLELAPVVSVIDNAIRFYFSSNDTISSNLYDLEVVRSEIVEQ